MELTPEERQRIYEEEKVRIEARDRIKAERRGKAFGCTGIGCAVVLGVFALFWILGSMSEASKTPEQRAKEEVDSCVQTWQLKLSEKGYSYQEGKDGAVMQCSAEIARWRQLKK